MRVSIRFHPDVLEVDFPRLDARIHKQILTAIRQRLQEGSPLHGKPLQKSLKGCRRLRLGNFRVVYKFYEPNIILVVAIRHRSEVYDYAEKRIRKF